MTRAADFPHNIPTDSLGLLAREPRAKTGAELRQETVHEAIKSAFDANECWPDSHWRGVLRAFAENLSHHEVTRPISSAIHDALAVTRGEKREEASFKHARVTHVLNITPETVAQYPANMVVTSEAPQPAMSTPFPSHELDVQPPAQAPKVEKWMKVWAPRARAYKSGDLGLDTALRWARTPQGEDYWNGLYRDRTPYPDLPQEARDYIGLIASADGGE